MKLRSIRMIRITCKTSAKFFSADVALDFPPDCAKGHSDQQIFLEKIDG